MGAMQMKILKDMGFALFLFFLIKGLVWLGVMGGLLKLLQWF
ncbi:MAG: alanyl-tRNA synthetase [Micrococcales bacterium]|nr:alanyl-tRNA synthetase [Micrococcales bacterium]